MSNEVVNKIVQDGLQLDADRYRALRQMFKNKEVSLELWGILFSGVSQIDNESELDDYLDAAMRGDA